MTLASSQSPSAERPLLTAEAWAAAASVTGVIVAITALVQESRRSRFSRAIDILSRLDDRFESPEFRAIRRSAAQYLLDPADAGQTGEESVRAILNFFETLAYLFKHHAVGANMVWHYYGSWLLPYYVASKDVIAKYQHDDPNCYRETAALYDAVFQVEENERNYCDATQVISSSGVTSMLRMEADLSVQLPMFKANRFHSPD